MITEERIGINDRQERCPGIVIPEEVTLLGFPSANQAVDVIDGFIMAGLKKWSVIETPDKEDFLADIGDFSEKRLGVKFGLRGIDSPGDVLITNGFQPLFFNLKEQFRPKFNRVFVFTERGVFFFDSSYKDGYNPPEMDCLDPEKYSETKEISPSLKLALLQYVVLNQKIKMNNGDVFAFSLFKTLFMCEALDMLEPYAKATKWYKEASNEL
jgi:hypothetical protein